jgi:CubicO group peptidase (beta-lactamase class C family)
MVIALQVQCGTLLQHFSEDAPMRKWVSWQAIVFACALITSPTVHAQSVEADLRAMVQSKTFGETRALAVWKDGRKIAQVYAPGYGPETRFVSWSMAKTVTALAVGMLIDEGKLRLDEPAPVPQWRNVTDGREKITLRHLLNMTSGLKHQEGSEGPDPIERADTVRLLFSDGAQSAAAYSISRPLEKPAGTHWRYSTATSHILADIVTRAVTDSADPATRRRVMTQWFKDRLWQPLGIASAEWDFDAAGLFLGGSLLHMTADDYGRLGQSMLLRTRLADGRALVSDATFAELMKKATASNNNHYAGHLWLNTGPAKDQPRVLFHPKGGGDTFSLIGHLGQYVLVVPSKSMVIVRLGKSTRKERDDWLDAIGEWIDKQ